MSNIKQFIEARAMDEADAGETPPDVGSNNGEDFLSQVRELIGRNDIRITKYSIEEPGPLFHGSEQLTLNCGGTVLSVWVSKRL